MASRKRQASSQNKEIVQRSDYLSVPSCQFEKTGLVIDESMTLEQWQEAGRLLRRIEGAVQWWIGDWLNFGEKKYGETYEKALENTEYSHFSLTHMKHVSAAIEISRRRPNLSWSHHQEVFALDPEQQDYWLDKAEAESLTRNELRRQIGQKQRSELLAQQRETRQMQAIVHQSDAVEFLDGFENESIDLLLTDPPYSTDVEDIDSFVRSWLPTALSKVKPQGRAFVCIGSYFDEQAAYASVLIKQPIWLTEMLVWTYRNTLGPVPALQYKRNWQAILHVWSVEAPPLQCADMNEQLSVIDMSAPDARTGVRYHTWEKPYDLAERFVRHATSEGNLVVDPFAGTGTFLLAAADLGHVAVGCDNESDMIQIAIHRGRQQRKT